jgi:uncharacterized phage protein (TIGR02218 family)
MLIVPAAATAHFERENRRLTICGVIEKNDGTFVQCTQHDEDIEIETGDLAGVYFSTATVTGSDIKSSSDMSVDNLEVSGQITDGTVFTGFTAADIEADLFDNAPFQTFLCQWDDPSAWQKVLRRGYLGEITRTAEGAFQCEWRGIFQLYQQNIGRTYGERCDVKRFGDARCKLSAFDLAAIGTVTAVYSRRRFDSTLALPGSPVLQGYFSLGELTWLSGANAGYLHQVKRDSVDNVQGHMETWESFPRDVQVGDQYRVSPGCDRLFSTCKDTFENVINFRGHGRWIPGIPQIIRAP